MLDTSPLAYVRPVARHSPSGGTEMLAIEYGVIEQAVIVDDEVKVEVKHDDG